MIDVESVLRKERTQLENRLSSVNAALDALAPGNHRHGRPGWSAAQRRAAAARMRKLWKTKGKAAFNK